MADIVARFADGRLLVQEEKLLEDGLYTSAQGVPFRIGHVRAVEKILSLEAFISGYGDAGRVLAPLKEATVSGDTVMLILRRTDIGAATMTGLFSGQLGSGYLSGLALISGTRAVNLSGYITLAGPLGSGTAALGMLSGVTSGLAQYGQIVSGVLISGKLNVIANVVAY